MNTAVKVGLWAAGIGALLWIGKKSSEAYSLVKGVSYKIVDFGLPKLSSNILSVPLNLTITNSTVTSLVVDNVSIAISLFQKDKYIPIGGANIAKVNAPPGTSEKVFIGQVDLQALTKNVFDTLATILQNNAITIKADVLVTVGGVTLPMQTLVKSIRV